MKRKVLVTALILAICFAFIPLMPNMEANAYYVSPEEYEAMYKINNAGQCKTFINDNGGSCTVSGNKVTLTSDLFLDKEIIIQNNENNPMIIDLNGHKIQDTTTGRYDFKGYGLIYKNGKGTLDIINSSTKVDADGFPEGGIFTNTVTCVNSRDGVLNMKDVTVLNRSKDGSNEEEGAAVILLETKADITHCRVITSDSGIAVKDYSVAHINDTLFTYVEGLDEGVIGLFVVPEDYHYSVNYSKTYLNNCTFDITSFNPEYDNGGIAIYNQTIDGEVNVNNCSINSSGYGVGGYGHFNINGGEINAQREFGLYITAPGNATVGGNAKIKGRVGIVLENNEWDEDGQVIKLEPSLTLKSCTVESNKGQNSYFGPGQIKAKDIIADGYEGIPNLVHPITYGPQGEEKADLEHYQTKEKIIVIAPEFDTAKLAKTKYTYTGKTITPKVIVRSANDSILEKGVDYDLTYATGRKAVGKYKVTVKLKGDYSGTKNLYFTIVPKVPAIKSMTAGTKSLKVTATTKPTAKGASTYQIAYRVKGTSTWKYATTTSATKTIKSLKKGKVYQVRMRAFKTVNKVKYYSDWSPIKVTKKIK